VTGAVAVLVRVGDVLSCSEGHPVWSVRDADVAALAAGRALWPVLDEACVFCGPRGRERAAWGRVTPPDGGWAGEVPVGSAG
jgi:hypothetical protein